ncbi:hypothetical protein [Allokutzneria oryzae]|uniref:Secreted protein n=1 Tax=Allokutzneria oryzae TaxID=1378989 RepID=A0ABV6A8V8_9PSEU
MSRALRTTARALVLTTALIATNASVASAGTERGLFGTCSKSGHSADFEVRYRHNGNGVSILSYYWEIDSGHGNKNNVEYWLMRVQPGADAVVDHWKSGDNVKAGRTKREVNKTIKKRAKGNDYYFKIKITFDVRGEADPTCTTTQGSIYV